MDNKKSYQKQKQNQNVEKQIKIEEVEVEDVKADNFGIVYNYKRLNVRTDASKKSNSLTVIDAGTKVKIIDENDGWTNVDLENGPIGYVMTKYLNIM